MRALTFAIRIGELSDSLLVARKLSSDMRAICAAPSYLERAGVPKSIKELADHSCLSHNAQGLWHLDGPNGEIQLRVKGSIHSIRPKSFARHSLRESVLACGASGRSDRTLKVER
jgi:DNA-binding transcriptional LysR family regulator